MSDNIQYIDNLQQQSDNLVNSDCGKNTWAQLQNTLYCYYKLWYWLKLKEKEKLPEYYVGGKLMAKNDNRQIQGVYKFNWTNFQETPGGISRKTQDMFALLRPAM